MSVDHDSWKRTTSIYQGQIPRVYLSLRHIFVFDLVYFVVVVFGTKGTTLTLKRRK